MRTLLCDRHMSGSIILGYDTSNDTTLKGHSICIKTKLVSPHATYLVGAGDGVLEMFQAVNQGKEYAPFTEKSAEIEI